MKKSIRLKYLFFLLFSIILMSCQSQERTYEGFIDSLMYSQEDLFGEILENKDKYELQIIYTQIDRDSLNQTNFTTYKLGVDAQKYFYPASSIKFPVALLALELVSKGETMDLYSPIEIDSLRENQIPVKKDTTSKSGLPSVGHYIRKLFLVSDNDAFNRLYEILGQAYINETLWGKGYKDLQIIHRLRGGLSEEDNRYTNQYNYKKDDKIFTVKEQYNPKKYSPKIEAKKGQGFINAEGELVKGAMDFSERNYISLEVLHQMLINIIFPESAPEEMRFDISPEYYNFLYQAMSELPRESKFPKYEDYEKYPDSFVKFLLFGNNKEQAPQRIRIFNKIGMAYGFMLDNAYIIDLRNNVEFFLSVVIYVNDNQIFNDDIYEYKTIAFPFMKNLGELFYLYERKRVKSFQPDLSRFQLEYGK